jgi:N-[(2S)-2-amino-2-carboxyethyl]-L-glutamate dehydrogenase
VKYINEDILLELGIDWPSLLDVVEDATRLIGKKEIHQPIKPYLRFKDPANRIIAMPAYVGGSFNSAGIKWIASFPGNLSRSIKRAHSVIILNDAETGIPISIINTALLSGIRTASVSGFVLKKYIESNSRKRLICGIIGFGPIGRLHLQMLKACFGEMIDHFLVYDIAGVSKKTIDEYNDQENIVVCSDWEDVYTRSDVFITCTVSSHRYVNMVPKKGAVYLNVSLRDFHPGFLKNTDLIVVDNWEEICRENTDIERASLDFGLAKKDVLEIHEILNDTSLSSLSDRSFMFNPMGMAVYDIAVAKYFYNLAVVKNNYIELDEWSTIKE